ncbi:hypothetical protein GDO86_016427 [Hymenochirus boettgeri]|uniref:Olfactory receptor n=1 Tax=Hymenochirus boettgeri TaxID=247094 RepID=A0A8T2K325_9PIPI|nr:hypothetical protein GDO86_016427 [Hymenochirus boettgeri]
MKTNNQNNSNGFVLLGFSEYPLLQIPLFCIFLLIYLLSLQGNFLILIVTYHASLLHIPMYFFLCNLSFIDILTSSISQPKLLCMLLIGPYTISFNECILQLYFFLSLVCAEFVLLTIMAYDRYVAICNPLRYLILMNRRVCVLLVITCWIFGFAEPLSYTLLTSKLQFCRSHTIDHYFCDPSILLKLSYTDTSFLEIMTFILGSLVGIPAFTIIVASYAYIISTVLNIPSSVGRKKAFSTCSSHLIVIILYYGGTLITYMRPSSQYATSLSKPFSILYTALIPSVNPFIYTLRNEDFKQYLVKIAKNN